MKDNDRAIFIVNHVGSTPYIVHHHSCPDLDRASDSFQNPKTLHEKQPKGIAPCKKCLRRGLVKETK